MPRLFAGIEIPDHLSNHLARLRAGLRSVRWIEPRDHHVTLRFLGDIDDALAGDIAELFAGIHKPPFTLELDGLDVFGGNSPRALFAKISPSPELVALQHAIEQLAQRAGCRPETRKFTPHITIARVKGVSREAIAAWLGNNGGFTGEPFEVDRFALFSARPSRGGGPYLVEKTYPLIGS